MIEAIEHEFDLVGPDALSSVLKRRGGIDGWTLSAVTSFGLDFVLFWSRTCPAVPNLGSEG